MQALRSELKVQFYQLN